MKVILLPLYWDTFSVKTRIVGKLNALMKFQRNTLERLPRYSDPLPKHFHLVLRGSLIRLDLF